MLFGKVFCSDIERLRSMEDVWKTRRPPEPLNYDDMMTRSAEALASSAKIVRDGQKTWSLEENFVVFLDSLDRLSRRMLKLKEAQASTGEDPVITFDKDDEDTLDFVAASANLRSLVFGIGRKSRFDIKQMAGNIIPAIATTNAIVAGLCVLEAFKILRGQYDEAKEVFLTPFASSRRTLLAPDKPRSPNPECAACGVLYTTVQADFSRATLDEFVEEFVRSYLGYGDKEFSVNNEVGPLCDPDDTENLDKTLAELGKSTSFQITGEPS